MSAPPAIRTNRAFCVALLSAAVALVALLLVAPAASAAGCDNHGALPNTISKQAYERAVICLTNKQRQKHHLKPVHNDSRLHEGAARHTREMLRRDCFDHECRNEKDLVGRLSAVGYIRSGTSWLVGENIAWGEREVGTPEAIVDAWMRSPAHRENILRGSFREIGVAVGWGRPGSSRDDAATVTQDFGRLG